MNEPMYEPPAVEATTPVEEPLNTTSTNSEPRTITPAWRRKQHGEE